MTYFSNDLKITSKTKKNDLVEFLNSLSKKTIQNFNHFGDISIKNVDDIADRELKHKDKIKFFSYFNNQLIAYSFLTKFDKNTKKHNCILGIVISEKWQKKGFGTKICEMMIKTAWKKGYGKIWLTVFSDNLLAIKLYKKLGFEVEGIFIGDEVIKNRSRDVISMAIFKTSSDNSKKRNRILDVLSEL